MRHSRLWRSVSIVLVRSCSMLEACTSISSRSQCARPSKQITSLQLCHVSEFLPQRVTCEPIRWEEAQITYHRSLWVKLKSLEVSHLATCHKFPTIITTISEAVFKACQTSINTCKKIWTVVSSNLRRERTSREAFLTSKRTRKEAASCAIWQSWLHQRIIVSTKTRCTCVTCTGSFILSTNHRQKIS